VLDQIVSLCNDAINSTHLTPAAGPPRECDLKKGMLMPMIWFVRALKFLLNQGEAMNFNLYAI
jgi:hypothetical protein